IDHWQQEMALTAFHHAAPQFLSVALISKTGDTVATTVQEESKQTVVYKSPVFRKALSGKSAISTVMFTKDNLPSVQMAEPVKHLGTVKHVLWGVLNLKSIWDILDTINIGQTGHVFIMDLSGRLIGHPEIDRVVKALPPERPDALIKIRRSHVPVEWIENNDHSKVYCVGCYIPKLDWIVVLSQNYSEIYGYLYDNIYWAGLITGFVCLVAILIGWSGVRRFLTPIYNLHRQVKKIGMGNLDQKVSVSSQDEIGELAHAFNEMTESLKAFIRREVETAKELVHAKNLAVLGTTSSKVTHEVGNLLNNVGLILPILRAERLSPKGQTALQMLEKDSARIREFIQEFLQFAKPPELNLKRESLEAVAREVLAVYEPQAKVRQTVLKLLWPSNLPPVPVDTRLIYQVLNNLVKNSFEAMDHAGGITVEGRLEDNHLLIILTDTGPGMSSEIVDQIFDPFFTTKGKKGTGLGLSIVKTIMEAHRGTIECRSKPGSGTTFILALPVQ
ncbi:MAG: sensor histidine kinase, partial [Deltaproteobacteria bacterium]|nr:sensor histidine kinase [Deltaproteobacteria bacterium]